MENERIITGESEDNRDGRGIIGGDGKTEIKIPGVVNTLQERIASVDLSAGLKALPDNFEEDGDWSIINSANPFEVLFLDYKQYKFITPDIVKQHYALLEKFWRKKVELLNTGGNRVGYKNTFGEGTVESSLSKLKRAFDKLNTETGIEQYYLEINGTRLKKGELDLRDSIEHMTLDGNADSAEIKLCLERGLRYSLSYEESAFIIKNTFDKEHFKPFGNPTGNLLSEQLLSVTWMTEENIKKAKEQEELRKRNGREILDNVYAYSAEEIGQIMFDHETEIKQSISRNLLSGSIAYFSPAKGSQFLDIVANQKNEHLRYLQVTYRLKPSLPYKFNNNQATTVQELVGIMAASPENFTAGKIQFKKGCPEVWLLETNKTAYQQLIKIRDNAPNADLAFLEFIYTFNPALPYRFNSIHLVKTQKELCYEIDKGADDWEAGKKELFNGSLIVWLAVTNQTAVVTAWNKVKDQFDANKDIGLEYFLHLLNDQLEHTTPAVSLSKIEYLKIQSGQIINTNLIVSNQTRGAMLAFIQFSKEITGVTLSTENILLSTASGVSSGRVVLTIDSNVLLKGVHYETNIVITTFEQKKNEIPLSFKIIFPKNAFLLETAKYAGIMAVFFALLRLLLTLAYPAWLNKTFQGFLSWYYIDSFLKGLALFGVTFFIFIAGIGAGIYFLIKYLVKNGGK